ncbi:pyridoxal phosphate-dependent aminotransferase [Asaia bogorensis]|uniref:Aminotransferase n=1 Tax=Asaia bogorensis NBRC 16594 TaxID=1231624 RepID=A0AAN4U388_9PROT|nr:pyridoxal phosphate-dependent aminotransferase [Asaia bogorensis]BAT19268.1 aspartate aminotransferase [Asaia bogorensis NBRC 16594]GBQ82378.1 aspartate aminotransferase [Asaia bogorensis NBRC 16594]GEL54238.1 aminotransferase [Asaia bogorensis NBRC 16594]
MSFRLAQRLHGLPQPATIAMSAKARALRAAGVDVISLALGEPDFPSPPEAVEAAYQAGLRGDTKYPPVGGQPALKAAVAKKFLDENGLSYAPEEILIGNGGKQLIYNAFAATIDPGDEVIVPVPYWVSYPIIAQMMGGVAVPVPCLESDRFRLRAEALRTAITSRTRWLVLNFPNNPSGAILERDDLEAIAAVLRDAPHVLVMADEIYEHLTFDGRRHVSLASVAPDLKDRILTINGMAKAYAMTGWRVGFGGGPQPLIKAMTSIQSNATSGICTLAQAGAVAALSTPAARRDAMRDVYQQRRDIVVTALRTMKHVSCAMPEGAFYAFPGIGAALGKTTAKGRVLTDDVAFAEALLEEAHVSVVPGSAFGQPGHIRLSVAASDDMLREACLRLSHFLDTLG